MIDISWFNKMCEFSKLTPLSQGLIMGISSNRPLKIDVELLQSMWQSWTNDFVPCVNEEQKKEWLLFFETYVPMPESLLDRMGSSYGVNEDTITIWKRIGWHSALIGMWFRTGFFTKPRDILNYEWDEQIARQVVLKVCFHDEVGMFQNNERVQDTIDWVHRKLRPFTTFIKLPNVDIVDWFFLRPLLRYAEGYVIWAGGAVQLLCNAQKEYGYNINNIYDRFEQENVDIDLFFVEFDDIKKWFQQLTLFHAFKIELFNENRYAKLTKLDAPSVRFKVNLIFFEMEWSTVNGIRQFTPYVLERFDHPACQNAVLCSYNSNNNNKYSFCYARTLSNQMMNVETPVDYNYGDNQRMKARFEKYVARGFKLVSTTSICSYGIQHEHLMKNYDATNAGQFFPSVSDDWEEDSLPLVFRNQILNT